jgi:hypothetical protein
MRTIATLAHRFNSRGYRTYWLGVLFQVRGNKQETEHSLVFFWSVD